MVKTYWIVEDDGWYFVTDGIWCSRLYADKADAQDHLSRALWGEGVNTI